ncbi:MAG TPA: hypothetical protein QF417_03325, partial [Acidimicrobiales bacterium]|nr:hypothetical protein [Acidimicrobiales bacterium]
IGERRSTANPLTRPSEGAAPSRVAAAGAAALTEARVEPGEAGAEREARVVASGEVPGEAGEAVTEASADAGDAVTEVSAEAGEAVAEAPAEADDAGEAVAEAPAEADDAGEAVAEAPAEADEVAAGTFPDDEVVEGS